MNIFINRDLEIRLGDEKSEYKQFWKQICLFGEYVNPNGGAKMVLDEELNLKPSLLRAWRYELIAVADFVSGKIIATSWDDKRFFNAVIIDENDFKLELFLLNNVFITFR